MNECWWCASGEPQSWHHLFTGCQAQAPQARKMWNEIGKACEWKHLRAPSVRLLWDGRAVETVLKILCTTRVRCIGMERVLSEDKGEISEGEERGPAPPRLYSFSFVFPLFFFSFWVRHLLGAQRSCCHGPSARMQQDKYTRLHGGWPDGGRARWGIVRAPTSVRSEVAGLHDLMLSRVLANDDGWGSAPWWIHPSSQSDVLGSQT